MIKVFACIYYHCNHMCTAPRRLVYMFIASERYSHWLLFVSLPLISFFSATWYYIFSRLDLHVVAFYLKCIGEFEGASFILIY